MGTERGRILGDNVGGKNDSLESQSLIGKARIVEKDLAA
jgi:hypothetical protein